MQGPGLAIAIMSKKKSDDSDEDLGEELGQQFLDAMDAKDAKAIYAAYRGMHDYASIAPEDDD